MLAPIVLEMNQAQDPGKISPMGDAPEVKKRYVQEPIESGPDASSNHSRAVYSVDLQCLDLATAFCKITIKDAKQTIPDKCTMCKFQHCKCPAFM